MADTITIDGLLVAARAAAGLPTATWGFFRLKDDVGALVTDSDPVSWEVATVASTTELSGSALVPGASITADVHTIELIATDGSTLLAVTDRSASPLPAGETQLLTRTDIFKQAV